MASLMAPDRRLRCCLSSRWKPFLRTLLARMREFSFSSAAEESLASRECLAIELRDSYSHWLRYTVFSSRSSTYSMMFC